MANSKDFKYDRFAGCSAKLTHEESERGTVVRARAEADREQQIYHPFYSRAEKMTGDDLTLYTYSWKQYDAPELTVKQGIANRKELMEY